MSPLWPILALLFGIGLALWPVAREGMRKVLLVSCYIVAIGIGLCVAGYEEWRRRRTEREIEDRRRA